MRGEDVDARLETHRPTQRCRRERSSVDRDHDVLERLLVRRRDHLEPHGGDQLGERGELLLHGRADLGLQRALAFVERLVERRGRLDGPAETLEAEADVLLDACRRLLGVRRAKGLERGRVLLPIVELDALPEVLARRGLVGTRDARRRRDEDRRHDRQREKSSDASDARVERTDGERDQGRSRWISRGFVEDGFGKGWVTPVPLRAVEGVPGFADAVESGAPEGDADAADGVAEGDSEGIADGMADAVADGTADGAVVIEVIEVIVAVAVAVATAAASCRASR